MQSKEKLSEILRTPLQELGLNDQESHLYVVSLSLGPSPIAVLAKHLGMARPNVYKLIAGLEKQGLARFSEKKKFTRNFIVESPTRLLELHREKQRAIAQTDERLTSFMPDLLALHQQGELPTNIKIIQGPDQFLKLFFQIIEEENKESCYFGSAQDFIGLISWPQEKEWIAQRMKKGMRIKALLLPSEDANTLRSSDPKELRETRIIKNDKPFTSSFQLFANKVIFWQPKTPIAVLVEDEYIAGMMKNVFEMLWKANE